MKKRECQDLTKLIAKANEDCAKAEAEKDQLAQTVYQLQSQLDEYKRAAERTC